MRSYENIDGKIVPSVTTIISILGSESLVSWANHMGFKHKDIKKILEESSTYGTLAHIAVRKIIDPSAPNPPDILNSITGYRINRMLENFKSLLSQHQYETICTEKEMVSLRHNYGGTSDWLCMLDSKKTIVDFKTSKKMHETMKLQLGGYYNLYTEFGETDIEEGRILLISDTGCRLCPAMSRDELIYYGKLFNLLADFYNQWINIKSMD